MANYNDIVWKLTIIFQVFSTEQTEHACIYVRQKKCDRLKIWVWSKCSKTNTGRCKGITLR